MSFAGVMPAHERVALGLSLPAVMQRFGIQANGGASEHAAEGPA
ncbi:MAG: hypothetical protein ACRD6I_04370 [Candidatus Acidiferrales bacterium]